MSKKHLKRLNIENSWRIKKKGFKYVTRPLPGPHNMATSMPLNVMLRDVLALSNTKRESRLILQNKNILINGKRRKELKFPVGLFDLVEAEETKEYFRVILDKKGKIAVIKIEKKDAELRPVRVVGKSKLKGKTQLHLSDGSNLIVDKDDFKTADTLILSTKKNEIKEKLPFKKKALVYLIGGKHISELGTVEDIKGNKITYKVKEEIFETLKDYAFVIGKDKPVIKVEK